MIFFLSQSPWSLPPSSTFSLTPLTQVITPAMSVLHRASLRMLVPIFELNTPHMVRYYPPPPRADVVCGGVQDRDDLSIDLALRSGSDILHQRMPVSASGNAAAQHGPGRIQLRASCNKRGSSSYRRNNGRIREFVCHGLSTRGGI